MRKGKSQTEAGPRRRDRQGIEAQVTRHRLRGTPAARAAMFALTSGSCGTCIPATCKPFKPPVPGGASAQEQLTHRLSWSPPQPGGGCQLLLMPLANKKHSMTASSGRHCQGLPRLGMQCAHCSQLARMREHTAFCG